MNIYFYAIIILVFLYFVIKIGGEKWHSFLIFASIFWFIGLTMVIGGCRKWMDYKEIQQTYSQTTAQITDVREYEVLDNDEIDIYYSPENPEVIVSPGSCGKQALLYHTDRGDPVYHSFFAGACRPNLVKKAKTFRNIKKPPPDKSAEAFIMCVPVYFLM